MVRHRRRHCADPGDIRGDVCFPWGVVMTQAYPLQWPLGWPRTKASSREYGKFRSASNALSLAVATQRVIAEVRLFTKLGHQWRINPDAIVLSTNLEIRKADGLPKGGQRRPEDPGAALYFELDGSSRCVPCDKYTDVEQNIAAIAATLSALRALERYGSGIMERAFTGFEALPPPPGESEPWWVVLKCYEHSDIASIELSYRTLRSASHPDKGGTAEQFDRIQKAYERACEERG